MQMHSGKEHRASEAEEWKMLDHSKQRAPAFKGFQSGFRADSPQVHADMHRPSFPEYQRQKKEELSMSEYSWCPGEVVVSGFNSNAEAFNHWLKMTTLTTDWRWRLQPLIEDAQALINVEPPAGLPSIHLVGRCTCKIFKTEFKTPMK